MAVNSNGSNNRVAGRDFHEKNIQIERYDGSQTVNIAIPSNNDDDDRPWLLLLQKLAILKRLLFGKKYMRRLV